MPILFAGSHVCEKCKKLFEWNYFEQKRQRINSDIKPEIVPQDKTLAHYCCQRANGVYDVEVNCPHCDFDNHFCYKGE